MRPQAISGLGPWSIKYFKFNPSSGAHHSNGSNWRIPWRLLDWILRRGPCNRKHPPNLSSGVDDALNHRRCCCRRTSNQHLSGKHGYWMLNSNLLNKPLTSFYTKRNKHGQTFRLLNQGTSNKAIHCWAGWASVVHWNGCWIAWRHRRVTCVAIALGISRMRRHALCVQ